MSKKRSDFSGLVYSTDPNFKLPDENTGQADTLQPSEQHLQVRLDSKQRAGKVVTLVQGFEGREEDLEALGKKLKSYCGTGGSVKEVQIIIQGDNRGKIIQWLQKNGYTHTRKI
jgi:translation initiation factor 1